ncbi:hypothetical protein [Sphingomonas crocodyli]|uniref:Glycosyltransferase RgtA/B/C/D-like domain-containing protein n=1 Tax=Sphingomonas crocodyli TaxID=1979270 RepID=A0A437MA66_9SPHN|nr:hypothetical protein [Sphingomonas crocodyli]RVT94521.1 hypothetical protein EOD43_11995 [Sphingomonas crocodyli]
MSDGGDVMQRQIKADTIWLVAIFLISALPYVFGLGFYTDDWDFFAHYQAALDGSTFDFVRAGLFYPALARPLQGLEFAWLYKMFGLNPLPYHLINLAVLAACMALLHRLLIRIGFDRAIAFALTLAFLLLPQHSTMRVWMSTFQVGFSLLFTLVAILADLRWERTGRTRWKIASLVSGALVLAFYEIFAPIILLGAALVGWRRWRSGVPMLRAVLPQIANVVVVGAAIVLKGQVSARATPLDMMFFRTLVGHFIDLHHDWRVDHGINLIALFTVHFGDTVAGPFRSIATMAGEGRLIAPLAAALAIGGLAGWRLSRTAPAWPARPWMFALGGVALMFAGYGTFLMSGAVNISPAGVANRTAGAAALGIALTLVAVAGMFAERVPAQRRAAAFAGLIAIMAVLATIRIADIGHYWTTAAARQWQLLDKAKVQLAGVPAGDMVIIDGVCPYIGPGIVFETYWDSSSALGLTLGRPIRADVVTDRLTWGDRQVETITYSLANDMPYGPKLSVWNPDRGWLVPLPDAAAARAYRSRPDRYVAACPVGYLNHGVPI